MWLIRLFLWWTSKSTTDVKMIVIVMDKEHAQHMIGAKDQQDEHLKIELFLLKYYGSKVE